MEHKIDVLVISYVRPKELSKLLFQLSECSEYLGNVYVWVNQGSDERTKALSQKCVNVVYGNSLLSSQVVRPTGHLPVYTSIPSALDYFFNKCPHGLVLEDDCIPNANFISFLCNIKKDLLSGSLICGSNSLNNYLDTSSRCAELRYAKIFQVWGWYGNKKIWRSFRDNYMAEIEGKSFLYYFKVLRGRGFKLLFSIDFAAKVYLAKKNILKTWDYQFCFYLIKCNYKSFVPDRNLVNNIGFNRDANNTFYQPRGYSYSESSSETMINILDDDYVEFDKKYQQVGFVRVVKTFLRFFLYFGR